MPYANEAERNSSGPLCTRMSPAHMHALLSSQLDLQNMRSKIKLAETSSWPQQSIKLSTGLCGRVLLGHYTRYKAWKQAFQKGEAVIQEQRCKEGPRLTASKSPE